MGSRDRKRAARHKRKARSARDVAGPEVGETGEAEVEAGNGSPKEGSAGRRARRTRLKDDQAREALEPLPEGVRPFVVTLGAILSTLLFAATLLGWALWETLRNDPRPPVVAVLVFAALVGVMAAGMWGGRYWAVLGFEALLVFPMLGSVLGVLQAATVLQALGNLLILAVAGTLFYFMVKSLARIQMPERRTPPLR
jgi:hypothetical protein